VKVKSYKLRFLEEVGNSITHGVGAALSIAALVILVVFAVLQGNPSKIVSFSIFGSSLIILYTASTLYHSFSNKTVKRYFKIFDHAAIYLLIAGTYTPFTLILLKGAWGWTIFGIIWVLAIVGVIFKLLFIERFPKISTTIYLLMGWLILIAIKPMLESVPVGGLVWLLAGGLAYSTGVIFYVWEKLPFNHTIWHLFVLAGSICHFFSVLFYVLPA
jgi:hemolysin III